jgi:hypothetical protein
VNCLFANWPCTLPQGLVPDVELRQPEILLLPFFKEVWLSVELMKRQENWREKGLGQAHSSHLAFLHLWVIWNVGWQLHLHFCLCDGQDRRRRGGSAAHSRHSVPGSIVSGLCFSEESRVKGSQCVMFLWAQILRVGGCFPQEIWHPVYNPHYY